MRQWMICCIAVLLAGCGMHDPIIHRLLEQGDGIPPRARMHSLDSVDDLEWLSMECQCNYFYLRVKARYDLGQVHAADTLLIAQAAYFERRGEPAKAAYLSLAAGRAFRETGVNEEAFRCISEAESLVCDLPDKFPLFCVYYEWGSLAAHEGDTGEANEQFGKMVALARAYPELQDHLETGRYALKAAKALLFLGDYGRAVYWYGKITARMVQMEDSARASAVFSEMAYSLDKTGRTVEALAYADSAQVYAPDGLSILRSTLLKASFYCRLEDAAALAVQLEQASSLLPAGGIRDRERYYYLLSQLCRLRGDYRAAYDNFMRYDAISDTASASSGTSWGKQMAERYARKKAEWMAERLQMRNRFYLAGGIALLLVALAVIYNLRRYLRQKEEKRIQAEDLAARLDHLLALANEQLQRSASRNLDVVHHLVRLRASAFHGGSPLKGFQLIGNGKGQLDWGSLYDTVNVLFDNFKDKLVAAYPSLAEEDVRLCCLFRAGFDIAAVANIFALSVHSIYKSRTHLRKQLGMPEGGDLLAFLKSRIS